MEINEIKIRLKGTANIPSPLTLEKDIDLTIKNAETVSFQEVPNHDGTANRIYSITITERSEITILCEKDIITARKKGSQGQKLRNILLEWYNQQFQGSDKYKDFEDFYGKMMSEIIEKYKNNLI